MASFSSPHIVLWHPFVGMAMVSVHLPSSDHDLLLPFFLLVLLLYTALFLQTRLNTIAIKLCCECAEFIRSFLVTVAKFVAWADVQALRNFCSCRDLRHLLCRGILSSFEKSEFG
jgi:hypothetical protein